MGDAMLLSCPLGALHTPMLRFSGQIGSPALRLEAGRIHHDRSVGGGIRQQGRADLEQDPDQARPDQPFLCNEGAAKVDREMLKAGQRLTDDLAAEDTGPGSDPQESTELNSDPLMSPAPRIKVRRCHRCG